MLKEKAWRIIQSGFQIAAITSLLLFVYLKMSYELRDPDIWLHLKTGEYILQAKTVPHHDLFSATLSNKEWVDHSWLVQVIFYSVFNSGETDNLIMLSALIMIAAFLFLIFSFYEKRLESCWWITPLLFITVFASQIRYNIRPENFSILFFSIYLFVCARFRQKKWLLLFLPFVQLLWVNCHGFFIIGPIMLAILLFAEALKRLRRLPWEWNEIDTLNAPTFRYLFWVFIASSLICAANPYGIKGVLYPFKVLFYSAGKFDIYYKYIYELLPPWELQRRLGLDINFFYLLCALSLGVFILNYRKINFSNLLLWLAFFAVSFRINRNMLFLNFFAFFSIADNLNRSLHTHKAALNTFYTKIKKYLHIIILLCILGISLEKINGMLDSRYYIYEEQRQKNVLLGMSKYTYPEAAANFVLEHKLRGNIFNLFDFGSYLIYRLYPYNKVFIDGRTELYGADFFVRYQKIINGDPASIEEAFKRYKIDTVILSGKNIYRLARYLLEQRGWALVYLDGQSLIFLRPTPGNRAYIENLKIEPLHWKTQECDLKKIGFNAHLPSPYINRAWMLYYLGFLEAAGQEARQAIKILPSASDAYAILGYIYLKEKSFDLAFENFRLAYIYGNTNANALTGLGDLYMKQDKIKEAIDKYKKLVKLNPSTAEYCYSLGKAYGKINNIPLAVRFFKEAIEISPYRDEYYDDWANLLLRNNRLQEAMQVYRRALQIGINTRYFLKKAALLEQKILRMR